MTRREFAAALAAAGEARRLPFETARGEPFRTGTAILPAGGRWAVSDREAVLERSGDYDVLVGEGDAPLARERWWIESEPGAIRWRIRREYLRDVRVEADRFPALVLSTRKRKGFGDIPGFLDPDAALSGTAAFPLKAGKQEWYEMISPRRAQVLHFAPSGTAVDSELESGFFSFAKPASDGTVGALSVGGESVDRRRGLVERRKGDVQTQTWTLRARLNTGAAPFRLELPERPLAEEARSLAAVHNQWMGWLFGNNPGSVPILHEMGWYPMIESLYARDEAYRRAVEKQLLFFADSGVEASGYPFPRWTMSGYYKVIWGNLMDQAPHFILAMYHHGVNTGSRDFIRHVMPAVERVARYLIALDSDGDGVVEVPHTSGLPDGKHDCSNWFDIIKFGHKDAYVNAYAVAALDALAEMKEFLGENAAEYRRTHARFVKGFNRVFWDERAGYYMDWVDVRGTGRRYFYTDPNLLAIIFGIAGAAKARRILGRLDERYAALCRQFGLSRDAIWATPANMYPVTQLGDLVDFGELGNQKVFPNYENGCSFFHTTGLEIAARGMAGQADAAYEVFDRVMRHGYAKNRLWAAALKWDTGELISEPLNNALLILWGFARGCLGLRPSLAGLATAEGAARRVEGVRYTFCNLGRDVAVEVRQGRAR